MSAIDRLPNALSTLRIPLGALIIFFYSNTNFSHYITTVFLIVLSLITDVLDGWLARKCGKATQTGYLLDGLGDRAVYVALILAFYGEGRLAGLIAWLLILREIGIYAVRVIRLDWFGRLKATRLSSVLHALLLRSWLLLVLFCDGLNMLGRHDIYDLTIVIFLEWALIAGALSVGYWSIFATTLRMSD